MPQGGVILHVLDRVWEHRCVHLGTLTTYSGTPRQRPPFDITTIAAFTPSGKRYDDPIKRLPGSETLLVSLREVAAIVWYRWQGRV